MMRNCVRKATPLILAFMLALVGTAFAQGDNAGVVLSVSPDTPLEGVGAGETVAVTVSAAGMVGVKQYDITLEVDPAEAFDLAASAFADAPSGFIVPGLETTATTVKAGAANFLAAVDGDAVLGTFNLQTSASFNSDTQATITVSLVSLGPTSTDRDEFAAVGTVVINPPPPPVTEPTLVAGSATDVSLNYSAIGEGNAADGSPGEATFSVQFTDNAGAAAAGQDISWAITNNGSESIFLVSPAVVEITAGATETVAATTGDDGSASGTFDSEGDKSAGTTTASIVASTTADNSEGVSRDLSVAFSATWDVAVAAELASFTAQVTVDEEVLLQWGVASQTNNLGWEVFRSVDNRSFEKVGDLVPGDGNSDVFKTYSFVDSNPPAEGVLYYYLRQLDLDGTTSRSSVIEVAMASTAVESQILPTANALMQNFPNPFNPETTIRFDLSEDANVTLTVYDAAGQLIRTLVQQQPMSAGNYSQVWDGLNADGVKVGSGIYFYQLKAGEFTSMKKMTLLQ